MVRTRIEGFLEAGAVGHGSGNDARNGQAESGGDNRVGDVNPAPLSISPMGSKFDRMRRVSMSTRKIAFAKA